MNASSWSHMEITGFVCKFSTHAPLIVTKELKRLLCNPKLFLPHLARVTTYITYRLNI